MLLSFPCTSSRSPIGTPGLRAIHKLGLERLLGTKRGRERDLVVAMIAEHLIHPGSKLTLLHWVRKNVTDATRLVGEVLERDPTHLLGKLMHGIVLYHQNVLPFGSRLNVARDSPHQGCFASFFHACSGRLRIPSMTALTAWACAVLPSAAAWAAISRASGTSSM